MQNGVGIQIFVSDPCSVTLHGHYVTKRQPSRSKSGPFEYAYPYPFESQFSSIFQDAEVGDKIETLRDPDDEDSRVAAIFDGTEWVSQGDYDFNTFTPGVYYVYTPYVKPNPLGDDMHLAQMVYGTDYRTSEDGIGLSLYIYKTSAWGQAIANGKLPLHIYNAEETLVASYTDDVGYTIQGTANPKNWSDADTYYEMLIFVEIEERI